MKCDLNHSAVPSMASSGNPVCFGGLMEKPSLTAAIGKLAIAGEEAGFTLEQMIQLLDDGLTVETLLDLISWRLNAVYFPPALCGTSSHWVC